MRIYLEDVDLICVEHKGEILHFDAHRTIRKTKLITTFTPGEPDSFDILNRYLALFSDDRANKLFLCYKRFLNTRTIEQDKMIRNQLERDNKYRVIVKDIFDILSYDGVYDWVYDNIKVVYPDRVNSEVDSKYSEDRTYTELDYFKLAVLSICFRAVVPIWCQYIYDNVDVVGNDRKEKMALKLLDTSDIIQTEPYLRFIRFIDAVSATVDIKNTYKTMTGIGSEEQLEISKAKKIVRRVAFLNPEIEDNIIKQVHNEIFNQPTDTQRNTNRIKDKKLTGSRDEEETSVIEQYKIKEELPRADSRTGSYYLEQELFLKEVMGEDYDLVKDKIGDLVDSLIESGHEMQRHNLMMAKFFISGVPPELLNCVNRDIQIISCAMVYALMVYKGKYNLALLSLGSIRMDDEDEISPPPLSNRATIPAELEKQLDDLYPYRRKVKSSANMIKEAIGELFREVSGCLIQPIFPQDDKALFDGKFTRDGYFITPRDVVVDLAEMIVFIQTRQIIK